MTGGVLASERHYFIVFAWLRLYIKCSPFVRKPPLPTPSASHVDPSAIRCPTGAHSRRLFSGGRYCCCCSYFCELSTALPENLSFNFDKGFGYIRRRIISLIYGRSPTQFFFYSFNFGCCLFFFFRPRRGVGGKCGPVCAESFLGDRVRTYFVGGGWFLTPLEDLLSERARIYGNFENGDGIKDVWRAVRRLHIFARKSYLMLFFLEHLSVIGANFDCKVYRLIFLIK